MSQEPTASDRPEKLLKAVDVAEILNISRAMAYQLMKQGRIQTVHIGTARRVRTIDLLEFITQNMKPTLLGDT